MERRCAAADFPARDQKYSPGIEAASGQGHRVKTNVEMKRSDAAARGTQFVFLDAL